MTHHRHLHVFCTLSAVALLMTGCANLPSSGPTAHAVEHPKPVAGEEGYKVLPLTLAQIKLLNTETSETGEKFRDLAAHDRIDIILPGDTLNISIYEIGVSLFGADASLSANAGLSNYAAHNKNFDNLIVDEYGAVRLPYLGKIMVYGSTPEQVQQAIEAHMRRKSLSPRATVTVVDSPLNSVYLSGDVRKPGRIRLSPARLHLLDLLTLGGGTNFSPHDTMVSVTRGTKTREMRLNAVTALSPDNIEIQPQDRVEISKQALTYLMMGASNKVSEVPFEARHITLAQALARTGGVNETQADPKAVYLFRSGQNSATPNAPRMVYKINLMDPTAYFAMQELKIRDKDLIYVANARANMPSKLISILNQLFAPVVTLKAIGGI